jgi:hypothetical protein
MLNLRRYGLTPEQFADLLTAQGSQCAICRTQTPGGQGWHVDHDHSCCNTRKQSCGKCFRGILCSRCDIAIWNLRDDPVIIQAALRYVLTHLKKQSGTEGLLAYFGMPDNRGEGSSSAKMTAEIVASCRRRFVTGETQAALAAECGVTTGAMSNAIRGKTWPGEVNGVAPVSRNLKPSQGTNEFRAQMVAAGRKGAAARWHPESSQI